MSRGPDAHGRWPQGTIHLPDWFGEDELKQLTAETLIDPSMLATKSKAKKLVKPVERLEWLKKHGQANEGLDIAVGCRALAWGDGAGQLSAERWAELVAEAHSDPEPEPTLFSTAPLPSQAAVPAVMRPRPKEDIDAMFERFGKANADLWS